MTRAIKLFLPVAILIVGATVAWQIYANGPKVKRQVVEVKPPFVEILTAQAQNVSIPVQTQGTVTPRTNIQLVAQVSGKIVKISPNFVNGGFFKQNEVLVKVDPSDYQLAITKAEAIVARANQQLSKADVEYQQAQQEMRDMGKKASSVSAYALKLPQLEEAKANLKAAQADLEIAKLQLERSEIRAPFDGRVLEKSADIGQYLTTGAVLAQLYAVDIAEVRLPISEVHAALLDIPYSYQWNQSASDGPQVTLYGQYAGRKYEWQGNIVRTEGGIDERNRLLYVVAQVTQPYIKSAQQPSRPPLAMGMFVQAQIEGHMFNNTFILPRQAVHGNDVVWVLDKESRLQLRQVSVLYRGPQQIYINAGIASGEQVIVSPLDAVVDGMLLRIADVDNNQGAKI